jgi:hypothetical protein
MSGRLACANKESNCNGEALFMKILNPYANTRLLGEFQFNRFQSQTAVARRKICPVFRKYFCFHTSQTKLPLGVANDVAESDFNHGLIMK